MKAWNARSFNALRNEDKKRVCPECKGELEYTKEEIVCKKCGLIIE